MAINITATIKCDRCEREQTISICKNSESPSFHLETHQLICDANNLDRYSWQWLDENGRNGFDLKFGSRKILCEACAEAYKGFIAKQSQQEKEFFKNRCDYH